MEMARLGKGDRKKEEKKEKRNEKGVVIRK